MFELFGAITAVIVIPSLIGFVLPLKYTNWATRWMCGILIIGILMSIIYNPLSYVFIVLLAITGTIRLIIQVRKERKHLRLHYPLIIGAITIFVLLLITWSDVLNNPLDTSAAWDAAVIWLTKAKHIYFWRGFSGIAVINYPNTGANLWAYVMSFSSLNEQFGRLIFPAIYAFWFAIIVRNVKNRSYSLLILWPIIAIGIYLLLPGTVNGYQDIFLGVIAATSAYLLANIIQHSYSDSMQKKWDLLLGLFFCGSLATVKNEGLVYALIILSCFIFTYLIQNIRHIKGTVKRNWKLLIPASGLIVLPIIIWNAILVFHNVNLANIQGKAFTVEGIKGIPEKLGSLPLILEYVVGYSDKMKVIILLAIFSALAATILNFTKKMLYLNIFLWLIVVMHTLFIIFTFLATNADIVWHLGTAANRLMMQHDLIYALIFILNTVFLLNSAYEIRMKKKEN